jgi:hypothetical protein
VNCLFKRKQRRRRGCGGHHSSREALDGNPAPTVAYYVGTFIILISYETPDVNDEFIRRYLDKLPSEL